MSLEREFRESVSNHLQSLNASFELELKAVLERGGFRDEAFIQIEYEPQSFDSDFSVYFYALDRKGQRAGGVHSFLKK